MSDAALSRGPLDADPTTRSEGLPSAPPRRSHPLPCCHVLITAAHVAVVIGVGLLAADLFRARARELDHADRTTRNVAAMLAARAAGTIRAVDQLLDDTGRRVDPAAPPPGAGSDGLDAQLRDRAATLPAVRWLALIDPLGRLVATSAPAGRRPDVDAVDRTPVPTAVPVGAGRLRLGAPRRDPASGLWDLPATRRLSGPDGAPAGLAAAAIDPAMLVALPDGLDLGRGGTVALLHQDGTLLAHVAGDGGAAGRPAVSAAGPEVLAARITVDGTPLVIRVGIDVADALAGWRRSLIAYLTAAAAMICLGGVTVLMALRGQRRAHELRATADTALRQEERTETLTASRRHLQNVLDLLFGFVAMFDREGAVIEINRAPLEAAGLSRHQVLGRPFWETDWWSGSPEARERVRAALRRAAAGEIVRYETPVRVRGGELIVDIMFGPLRDDSGGVVSVVGFAVDVTERRAAEERLRRNQNTLSGILRISPEAIIVTDRDLRIRTFSRGAVEIFGYEAEEVLGVSLDRLIPPRYRQSHARHVEAFTAAPLKSRRMGDRGEIVALHKSGEEFPAEASISKLQTDGEIYFTVILRDVRAHRAARQELSDAKERAEAASTAKSLFVANMSHELRTPLNAVIGFSQIMKTGAMDGRDREYAGYIESSGQHLLNIVNNILDLSQMEVGKMRLAEERTAVTRLIDETLAMLGEVARQGRIDLRAVVASDAPAILVDPRLFRQILINLVTNAVKFTPAGGRVDIDAHPVADGGFEVVVRDTGIGIAARDIPRAMQPFVQLDNGIARRFEGAGLGLSIVKSFVDLHGGRFNIASAPERGTAATVWLPPERVIEPAADGPDAPTDR